MGIDNLECSKNTRVGIYYRVSTEEQTLGMQRHAVEEWLERRFPEPPKVKSYEDIGISGATANRPGFQKLLTDCEKGRLDMIVVYKLDRLTRSAITAIRTILRFDEMSVYFVSVSQPMFDYGVPMRRTMISAFAEIAEMEREIIIERVKAGLAAAVKRGQKLGAPIKATDEKIAQVGELRDRGLSIKKISEEVDLSVGTVHKITKALKESEE